MRIFAIPSSLSRLARHLPRRLMLLGFALCVLACTPAEKDKATGNTLRIAFFMDNPNLVSIDPFQVYWIEHRIVLRNLVESLTDQNPETGEIIPWLAHH